MSELINPSAEPLLTGEQMLAQLRDERWHNAEARCAREMTQTLHAMNRIAYPEASILSEDISYLESSNGFAPAECVALKGIGIDPESLYKGVPTVADQTSDTPLSVKAEGRAVFVTSGEATMRLERLDKTPTFTTRLNPDDGEAKKRFLADLSDAVTAAFARSPAYQEVKHAIDDAGLESESITFHLNVDEDPQGVLSVLSNAGLFGMNATDHQVEVLAGKKDAKAAIIDTLLYKSEDAGQRTDDFVTVAYGRGLRRTIYLDRNTNDMSLTLKTAPEDLYAESADQCDGLSEPFIDSQCAKELFGALAEQGLTIGDALRREMVRPGKTDRWGSVYTQLTREIAKWVNRPTVPNPSRLVALQAGLPDDYSYDDAVRETTEGNIRAALSNIPTANMNEPARVLLDLMQQVIRRPNRETDLKVTEQEVGVRAYACVDTAQYYVDASKIGKLYLDQSSGVPMLTKSHGGETFLTTTSVLFNGVKLPKGSLFSKATDGGWFFQRLTPFTFDEARDARVFGTEVLKVTPRQSSAKMLGGITLAHLKEHIA